MLLNSAIGDSLAVLQWEVVGGERVLTYQPPSDPVIGKDYIDNIEAMATGTNYLVILFLHKTFMSENN